MKPEPKPNDNSLTVKAHNLTDVGQRDLRDVVNFSRVILFSAQA